MYRFGDHAVDLPLHQGNLGARVSKHPDRQRRLGVKYADRAPLVWIEVERDVALAHRVFCSRVVEERCGLELTADKGGSRQSGFPPV